MSSRVIEYFKGAAFLVLVSLNIMGMAWLYFANLILN